MGGQTVGGQTVGGQTVGGAHQMLWCVMEDVGCRPCE